MKPHDRPHLPTATIVIGALAAGAAATYAVSRKRRSLHPSDDAPKYTAKHLRTGDYAISGRSITINRPRQDLYAYWRDFSNLPTFMENIKCVRSTGDNTTVWTIAAPAGQTVDIETEIVEDRENELISWRSVEGSDIETRGHVRFTDAPAGRGTHVEALVAYKPPGGDLGRWIAKLFQREPKLQGRRELRRFKMLMETGEIATARNRRQPEKGD